LPGTVLGSRRVISNIDFSEIRILGFTGKDVQAHVGLGNTNIGSCFESSQYNRLIFYEEIISL
jgi:hypothetical protein